MPLRDHFRPPLDDVHCWDELHGMWPAIIVRNLNAIVPEAYLAAPTVHLAVGPRSSEQDVYEVRLYERTTNRQLRAAIEIVSPSNKDHSEGRGIFVSKIAALLKHDVCVSIVDVVTTCNFNFYTELLNVLGHADPAIGDHPPPTYAATHRVRYDGHRYVMESWYHPLTVGSALPTLPIWLNEGFAIPLDLEASYEEACRTLRIR